MSEPAITNAYSVVLMVTAEPQGQQTQKQVNVLASSIQEAVTKAVSATPNSVGRQCNLICVVNIA